MIIKKKILSNELITRNLKNIALKDKYLFEKDIQKKTGESYIYFLKNKKILNDGKINTFNKDIISDFLGFKNLSKLILIKKILLYVNYIVKIISQNIFIHKIYTRENCIIIYNRNSIGFFHWTLDSLPKIIYIKKKYKGIDLILPKNLDVSFIRESLKKIKVNFFFIERNTNYYFRNIIYVGDLYPSGSPRSELLVPLKKIGNINYKKKRIFISRNKSKRRNLSNENKLIKILKKYNFEILYSEKLSFDDQIKKFSSAKYVIGLHGAGISNIIWMKEKSYLLELKPELDLFLNCYFNLAKALKINYDYLICQKNQIFRSSKYSNYIVDEKLFEKKLEKIFKNENKKN